MRRTSVDPWSQDGSQTMITFLLFYFIILLLKLPLEKMYEKEKSFIWSLIFQRHIWSNNSSTTISIVCNDSLLMCHVDSLLLLFIQIKKAETKEERKFENENQAAAWSKRLKLAKLNHPQGSNSFHFQGLFRWSGPLWGDLYDMLKRFLIQL